MILGNTAFQPFTIPEEILSRHLLVIGMTGMGKTAFLENMIAQIIQTNAGFCFVDPHGDTAQTLIGHIPLLQAHKLIYIAPSTNGRPIAINPLHDVPLEKRDKVAQDIASIFMHIWDLSLEKTPWLLDYIYVGVRTLLDVPDATLLGVPKLFLEEDYRTMALKYSTDQVIQDYWEYEFPADLKSKQAPFKPILVRFRTLLASPALRNMLGQVKSSIDFRGAMDEGKVLVVNLSKGTLGAKNAYLLGSLVTNSLLTAAMSRADTVKRPPFYLLADEFQNYTTDTFTEILSEARKYELRLVLAHQFLGQLPESVRLAVLGNVGTVVSFRIGADDAPVIARHFGYPNPDELQSLSNFETMVKLSGPSNPEHVKTLPPPKRVHNLSTQLIRASERVYGRDRLATEERIKRFLEWGKLSHATQTTEKPAKRWHARGQDRL